MIFNETLSAIELVKSRPELCMQDARLIIRKSTLNIPNKISQRSAEVAAAHIMVDLQSRKGVLRDLDDDIINDIQHEIYETILDHVTVEGFDS